MIKTFEQYTAFNKLTNTAESAAAELADAVMETISWDFLKNATDIDECDNNEISWIINLANDDPYFCKDLDAELYSIKDIFQKTAELNAILDKYDIELEFDWNEYCSLVGQCFDMTPHIF